MGVCKINLRFPENESLKGKRQIVNSLRSKIRNKFNVSMAEVGGNEAWQVSTIGITCVGNDSRHLNEVIDSVLEYIENSRLDLDVLACEQEILSGF
ncbi:MAG: DUF503 domain-containing protein [Gammaproteobacteria bacterium]|nr:DUF503 domain-containing protein [Gammaproteobacteria bacterium]